MHSSYTNNKRPTRIHEKGENIDHTISSSMFTDSFVSAMQDYIKKLRTKNMQVVLQMPSKGKKWLQATLYRHFCYISYLLNIIRSNVQRLHYKCMIYTLSNVLSVFIHATSLASGGHNKNRT